MKNLNPFIAGLLIFIACFLVYHNNTVKSLETEVEYLTIERDQLKNKITLIENGLRDFGKPNTVKESKKTVKTKKEVLNTNKTDKTKSEIKVMANKEDDLNTMDITLNFPNRTGQDLVNSLKLKTEL